MRTTVMVGTVNTVQIDASVYLLIYFCIAWLCPCCAAKFSLLAYQTFHFP